MVLPTKCIFFSTIPSFIKFSLASGLVVKRNVESLSVRTRFISSGIFQSKLRKPDSTWPIGTPNFAAANEHAIVELTSPKTIIILGWSSTRTFSYNDNIFPVCSPWDPLPTSKLISGFFIPSSWINIFDIFSS